MSRFAVFLCAYVPLCHYAYVNVFRKVTKTATFHCQTDRQSSSLSYFPLCLYFDKCIRIHRNLPVSFLILTGGICSSSFPSFCCRQNAKEREGRKRAGSARRTNSHFVCKSARINRIRAGGLSRAQEVRGQESEEDEFVLAQGFLHTGNTQT